MFAVVDRFEGKYAVVEMDGNMVNIELSRLPNEVKEGDVLDISENSILIDKTETEKRRKNIKKRTDDMWIE